MTEYLDLAALLRIGTRMFGQSPEVRDAGLLESALARPQATVFGTDAYPDLDTKAAALLSSLTNNHALVDGNKRLAWAATFVFYGLNDRELHAPHDEAFDLVVSIADGTLVEVEAIADRLRWWTK